MNLPYDDLVRLRTADPAWRLLTADRAPLIASFLDHAFRESNHRVRPESELILLLEDVLYDLRRSGGDEAFPRDAREYLSEWAQDDKGWLRRFYPPGNDEPHYDLTPGTERALGWLDSLFQRGFVGTESRLFSVIHLLEQIVDATEEDAETRIARLEAQKAEIDGQIASIRAGDLPTMDDRALRERFLHVSRTARELLADFRAVEHNFRELDRTVREQIAGWSDDKARLLHSVFGNHDAIADSDEGRSFRAFWDFLMAPESQSHLSKLLDTVFELPELADIQDDHRMRRIHYDWISAGEQTQRTVARLSQQLRRFLDNQTYLEHRRIMELLNTIGKSALSVRDEPPRGTFMEIDGIGADVSLPLERPLYTPSTDGTLSVPAEEDEPGEVDLSLLFNQVVVDTEALRRHVRHLLVGTDQVTLAVVVERFPLSEGLAELVGYLSVATGNVGNSGSGGFQSVVSDDHHETITWKDRHGVTRRARVPQIIFTQEAP